jgi:hypothetical protein
MAYILLTGQILATTQRLPITDTITQIKNRSMIPGSSDIPLANHAAEHFLCRFPAICGMPALPIERSIGCGGRAATGSELGSPSFMNYPGQATSKRAVNPLG